MDKTSWKRKEIFVWLTTKGWNIRPRFSFYLNLRKVVPGLGDLSQERNPLSALAFETTSLAVLEYSLQQWDMPGLLTFEHEFVSRQTFCFETANTLLSRLFVLGFSIDSDCCSGFACFFLQLRSDLERDTTIDRRCSDNPRKDGTQPHVYVRKPANKRCSCANQIERDIVWKFWQAHTKASVLNKDEPVPVLCLWLWTRAPEAAMSRDSLVSNWSLQQRPSSPRASWENSSFGPRRIILTASKQGDPDLWHCKAMDHKFQFPCICCKSCQFWFRLFVENAKTPRVVEILTYFLDLSSSYWRRNSSYVGVDSTIFFFALCADTCKPNGSVL